MLYGRDNVTSLDPRDRTTVVEANDGTQLVREMAGNRVAIRLMREQSGKLVKAGCEGSWSIYHDAVGVYSVSVRNELIGAMLTTDGAVPTLPEPIREALEQVAWMVTS